MIRSSSQENFLLLIQKQFILLICNNSTVPPTPSRHNHYVPLIFCLEKNKVNKKRKLVTSQKCKESKKRATDSIHHFWKQDLSANNKSLPNFADDLNLHKNPSVSKYLTFNIISDNLSSLDNNLLKMNGSEQLFISKSSNSDSISISISINKSNSRDCFFLVVKLNIV